MLIYKNNLGIIALATIVLISAIILEIALVTAFVVYTLNNINYGSRLSTEALSAAQSGVDDALLKLSRNKDSLADYSLSVGARTSNIMVVSSGPQITIISEGRAFNKYRKIQAIFNVDQLTGLVSVASQKELSF